MARAEFLMATFGQKVWLLGEQMQHFILEEKRSPSVSKVKENQFSFVSCESLQWEILEWSHSGGREGKRVSEPGMCSAQNTCSETVKSTDFSHPGGVFPNIPNSRKRESIPCMNPCNAHQKRYKAKRNTSAIFIIKWNVFHNESVLQIKNNNCGTGRLFR